MVDCVITYVDSKDNSWVELYKKYVKTPLENVENRFRSYDCLDLQIKLIRKNMKFINNIFVVVSSLSQVPKNIKELENVFIITHEQIIPKRYLPCFNSCTIELYLYNIKDLSENFIYFNDDIFPIKPYEETEFFKDGKIVIDFERLEYDIELATPFQWNIINSTRLFDKYAKKFIKPKHYCFPAIKSHMTKIWKDNVNYIQKTLTRTRNRTNLNFYTFISYEITTNNYIKSESSLKFFNVSDNLENVFNNLNDYKIVCCNDNYAPNFDVWKIEFRKFLTCLLEDTEYIKENIIEKNINNKLLNLINKESNTDIIKYINKNNIKEYKNGFSICLTAFKTEKYIEECLDSIQNQTYFINNDNYEIILVIDHCYDTLEKVKSIMNKYKNLIIIMLNENVGTYVASNTAMSLAKYKWLIRFDTDDIMKPYMIETISYNLDNCDIIQYKLESFSNDGTPFKPFNDFANGSIVIKKEIFDLYGGYRDWICSGDYEILVRLSFLRIKKLDIQLFNYRRTLSCLTKNIKTNGKSIIRKQYNDFINKEKEHIDEPIIECKTCNFIEINKQTIIVNVTTYPARDMFLYKALLHFKKQTLKPTKIILWLAKDEYNELSLPNTITKCIDDGLLDDIMFVEKNIYCHKRHECFKYFNYAFNIFIDDDIYYPITFVESLVYYSSLYNSPTSFFGKNMEYINSTWSANTFKNGPNIKNRYYGGLSCIPPYIFPIESLNYENERDIICPKCDESWLQMWFIKKNIKVYCINEWKIGESPFELIEDTQKVSMWNENKQVKNNILKKVNNIAKCVVFLNIEDKAKQLWPKFNIEKSCDGEYDTIKKLSQKLNL